MSNRKDLSQEQLDALLLWLGPTREEGAERYEQIRRSLVRILSYRSCIDAEEMADETINRVAQKLPKIINNYRGNPAFYFYGVADKVFLEYQKRRRKLVPLPPRIAVPNPPPPDEAYLDCIEKCMRLMKEGDRELVELYYQDESSSRISKRKDLAGRLGLKLSNLRVKVFRLTSKLQGCTEKCVQKAKT